MKPDFERWLAAQFADTGPFTAHMFVGLGHAGEPLADSIALDRGRFFDRQGRRLHADEIGQ